MNISPTAYEIKLPQFEGPFDLLLFFIERDEIDIYDIPIAQITTDFLAYLNQLEMLDIELASEFMVVAATLMRIKAKMLLPRKEIDEAGNEIDPRQELVQKLIEYKTFKETLETFKQWEDEQLMRFKRGNILPENEEIAEKFTTEAELESLTLFKLFKAFQKIMERFENNQRQSQHIVERPPFTIASEKDYITQIVQHKNNTPKQPYLPFIELFTNCSTRLQAVFRFLAMLEMVQEQQIKIRIGEGLNNFWVLQNIPENEAHFAQDN